MASNNINLGAAKTAKNDEFYTQLYDIELELKHYRAQFKDKVVLCNCDDPRVSNFYKYFAINFEILGLKRLICTCYKNNEPDLFSQNTCEQAVYFVYDGDKNGNKIPDPDEIEVVPLKGDGDFRSQECIELLKQADIICTNPPFSLIREYVAQLIKYDKKFLIISRTSALHASEIFPLIKNDKVWLGYGHNVSMVFGAPYENTLEANRKFVKARGYNPDDKFIKVPALCWLTNMDVNRRHEELIMYKHYSPNDYPKYYNYDAIDVDEVAKIPCDYFGAMGVPDTFLGVYNPEQFEIIGLGSGKLGQSIGITGIAKEHKKMMKGHSAAGDLYYIQENGMPKVPYSRVIIRRKQQ